MSYEYSKERCHVFTEDGQKLFLAVRDRVKMLLSEAGAFDMGHAMPRAMAYDSWQAMACVDRLVELDEIIELTKDQKVIGQHRTFVSANR
jgi:hypothetical protein